MELGFIQNLQNHFNPHGGVDGIGDDGVFIPPYVYVSDTVVEGVHFFNTTPWHYVLTYLFNSNISDMAAMGVRAEYGILNISASTEFLSDEVANIIKTLCHDNSIQLVGGDTCNSSNTVLSLTLFGRVGDRGVLTRSGANEGDVVFVSRPIGLAGIALANEARHYENAVEGNSDDVGNAVNDVGSVGNAGNDVGNVGNAGNAVNGTTLVGLPNLHPYYHYRRPPESRLGELLGSTFGVTSCMDISDGLGVDLSRLGRSSGVRCVVHEGAVPLSHIESVLHHSRVTPLGLRVVGSDSSSAGRLIADTSPLEHFLTSGQEFALLFTVSRDQAQSVAELVKGALGCEVIPIGWCEEGNGEGTAVLQRNDGAVTDISNMGWVHGK